MLVTYSTQADAVAFAQKASADQVWRAAYYKLGEWRVASMIGGNQPLCEPTSRYISPEGEVFRLVPDLPLTHIEYLWDALEKYRQTNVRALRDSASFERNTAEARTEFAEWCRLRGLPIDFTPR